MKYSVLLPIKNRSALLRRGLQSYAAMQYDKKDFEIIIVDYGSDDDIVNIINEFSGVLNMKYVLLDMTKYTRYKPSSEGYYNPCVAQNVAFCVSSGDYIILTSPEIIHDSQNMKNFDNIVDIENFIYGNVIEKFVDNVGEDFCNLRKFISDSDRILCDEDIMKANNVYGHFGVKNLHVYYIGCMHRTKYMQLGGMDEVFIIGCATEDTDFAWRAMQITQAKFSNDIFGIHLPHSRSYQNETQSLKNRIWLHKKITDMNPSKHILANKGVFGSLDIVSTTIEYMKRGFF